MRSHVSARQRDRFPPPPPPWTIAHGLPTLPCAKWRCICGCTVLPDCVHAHDAAHRPMYVLVHASHPRGQMPKGPPAWSGWRCARSTANCASRARETHAQSPRATAHASSGCRMQRVSRASILVRAGDLLPRVVFVMEALACSLRSACWAVCHGLPQPRRAERASSGNIANAGCDCDSVAAAAVISHDASADAAMLGQGDGRRPRTVCT